MTTPNAEAPNGEGSDSVVKMHDPLMAQMNDPVVLSVDGTSATLPGRSGSDSVQAMHDPLMREQAEPRDGFEPVPFWVTLIFGALLAWGGYYAGTNAADFRRDVFDRSDLKLTETPPEVEPDPKTVDELMTIGKRKYQAICAACHQPDGKGNPSQNVPPLDGSEWLVGVQASPARLSRIVLYGLSGPIPVGARTYNNAMPNQGNVLKDYEIAGVLTYVRNSWGNKVDAGKPPSITPAVVRAARTAEGSRRMPGGVRPMTANEVLKLPVDHQDGTPASKS